MSNDLGFGDMAALLENNAFYEHHKWRAAELLRLGDQLLAMVRRYASECGKCGGKGECTRLDSYGRNNGTADCPECADIRHLLSKATPGSETT